MPEQQVSAGLPQVHGTREGKVALTISVVIPAYNAAEHIGESLESVLAQSYSASEVIVVDDASTDATPQIVSHFCERDPRVQLIRLDRRTGGPARPRNVGIEASRGDYIALLDSDDLWMKDKLLLDVRYLNHDPADIIYSGAIYFSGGTEHVVARPRVHRMGAYYLFMNYVPLLTVCAKRSFLLNGGLRFDDDPRLKAIEDYNFLLRAYLSGARIMCRPGRDSLYRYESPTSIYARHDFAGFMRRVLYNAEKIGSQFGWSSAKIFALKCALAGFYGARRFVGRRG